MTTGVILLLVAMAYALVVFFSWVYWEYLYGTGKGFVLGLTWPIWAIRASVRYIVEHWKEG